MKKVQQDTSKDALVEYKNWIKTDAFLLHRFFELENSAESYIKKIYLEPKPFVNIDGQIDDRFVTIGGCGAEEKICISVSEKIGKGKVYWYGFQTIREYYVYRQDGDIIDVEQSDVYGFDKLADSFSEFLQNLYTNMSFEGVEELEPVKYD
jgi:hypothetical protein